MSARKAIGDAQYSPSYGVVVPCRAIDLTTRVLVDGAASWTLAITS